MTGTEVTPADLKRRLDAGERVAVLDVRDRDEVEAWHIEGPTVDLQQVPYNKFVAAKVSGAPADLVEADEVVVVCGRGEASAEVADILRDAGVDARNLAGGMRAWARLYEAHEVDCAGHTVVQYQRPSSGCLAYMVVDGGEALVVDPLRAFADRYAADAADRGVDLVTVVDTHVHADHVSGLREVGDAADATRVMSRRAVDRGVTFAVETVADGDELAVGDAAVEVVATPGHTTGMVSLFIGDLLLTGDTLFVEAVPRPDLEGASGDDDADPESMARELHRTLTERLARFDDDVLVAPGHYAGRAEPRADGTYTARLGTVRDRLPAFSQPTDAFVEAVLDRMPPKPKNFETIVAVNLGRETVTADEGFELELGPNNCAATAD